MMIDLVEVAERSRTGVKMASRDWELGLFKKIEELIKEHNLGFSKAEEFLNTDNSVADAAFKAAVDFIVDVGAYCISTGRIIRFSEDEVKDAIKAAPREIVMGEGKDVRIFKQGKIEGKEPLNICPGHHAPFTEDLGTLVVKNFAQIPRADFLEGFNFPEVDGREILGPPLEAYASRKQAAYLREGIRRAGKPGMAIVYYPISTRASSFLSVLDQECGLRSTDGVLFTLLPDVKIEYDYLTSAIIYEQHGFFGVNGSFGIMGGFCGGPEGAAVESIARTIVGWMVYRDKLHYPGVEHMLTLTATKMTFHPINNARSVVYQALNRNSNAIYMEWVIPSSELCTEEHLWESAVRSIEGTINGANLYAHRVSRPRMNAGQTPLEAEFMIEVSDATLKAGLKRGDGGELLKKITGRLEGRSSVQGKTIQECYDLVKHRPSAEYGEIYGKVKKDLADLGLEFE
jgi:methylamine--corrinoid protein Co-methyltransferase